MLSLVVLIAGALSTGTGPPAVAGTGVVGPLAPDEARSGDQVGFSLDRTMPHSVVGALGTDSAAGADVGAAYVYDLDQSQSASVRLEAADPVPGEALGSAVAVSGSVVLAGAPSAGAGRVVVFALGPRGWSQSAVLTPPSAGDGQGFGSSVDIDGDTVVVDALRPGGAGQGTGDTYIYRAADPTQDDWSLEATIPRSSESDTVYRFNDLVSLVGDRLAIGDPYADVGGASDQGQIELYTRSGTSWTRRKPVTLPASDPGANLGGSIELDRDRIVAGAPHDSSHGAFQSGGAAVFARVDGHWSFQQTLEVPRPQRYGICGAAVDLFRDAVEVGCPFLDHDGYRDAGLVARFKASPGGSWQLNARQVSPDEVAGGLFGRAVVVGQGQILFGSTFALASSGAQTGGLFLSPG